MPLDIETIQVARPQNELHYFRRIPSTMTEAGRLAASGAPHGTVVLADEQTAGLGRFGRSWQSEAEMGIYCSIVLRLPLGPSRLPILTLLLALAAADAIQKSVGLACDLRWPNDVLIRERKAAGILADLLDNSVIGGIGINVNNTSMPLNVRTPATSLRLESGGCVHSREVITIDLLESIDVFCSLLVNSGPEPVLRAFTTLSSYAVDRRVVIEETGQKGITAGMDENGFLLVRLDNGRLERIPTGGIRADYCLAEA